MPLVLERKYSIEISEKKCQRIKKKLGLRTLYPHRDKSASNPRAKKESYLLANMEIKEVDQVWTSDITYIQINRCNYYLCAVMDWDSRFVLGWSMGRHMDVSLCLDALDMALKSGRCPQIFNTDQGSQYTSKEWRETMLARGIKSAWTAKGVGQITLSWSVYGGPTSTSFSCIENPRAWERP